MAIKHKNKKFYVEIFTPEHNWKYLGKVSRFKDENVFVTHIKNPEKHFYIKEQGYPINKELLDALHNARIRYILIPERGKTGFRAYISKTDEYRHGTEISEPLTERQKVIPLRKLHENPHITEKMIYNMLK